MKLKFYYFLLIPVIISLSFMTLPFLRHLKNEVKKEVRTQIFLQNLDSKEIVKFNAKDLKQATWIEDKEFIFEGYYYDLVSIKIINGEKIHYCFKDKKETKIANIESKIRDIFSVKFSKPEIKPYFVKIFKLNPVFKNNSDFFVKIEGQSFLKTNVHFYQFSIKFSDFIEKPSIPPEV
ncbi:hypothetical protein SAMN05421847_1865 [Halpernia humi]|uniref:Uncharacterized protein n=1 Tax=Halpernia humi TaxID=493375 RepID=A0A1H5YTT8_9FLAO|nr:hypothetical protein [Halpernia humi]SEG27623.1 hypothetical protein SAMN05421847_1865 [Halpernia humi]